eukprot:CAMPEP_0172441844 /NCGR_PEP_ID=MMETSP1065-20121228/2353_1 /TAXON_ID=265537 /ORGANISM="Amphiprora paludosa, Strain CCMP125" /LENGTH=865 /DNA_ID=CAMNT_0013191429 /DNA_START=29 /DNA_END=2623 /DNA_ORIENTATION=-
MLRSRPASSRSSGASLPLSKPNGSSNSDKADRRSRLLQKRRVRLFFQNRMVVFWMFGMVLVLSFAFMFFSSGPSVAETATEKELDGQGRHSHHHRHHGNKKHHGGHMHDGEEEEHGRQRHAQEEIKEHNHADHEKHHNDHHFNGHKHRTESDEEEDHHGCNMGRVRESEEEGLAQCEAAYAAPITVEPEEGWLKEIDFFHFRGSHTAEMRATCYIKCIEMVVRRDGKHTIDETWLIEAAALGMPKVVEELLDYDLDPFYHPPAGGLNAIQAAIRGGYAKIVKILTKSDYDVPIDKYGRSVRDYVNLKGSPIRPVDARDVLDVSVTNPRDLGDALGAREHYNDFHSGWSQHSDFPFDDTKCDIDVLESISRDDFFRDYYSTGRPFVIRNFIPQQELDAFSKDRWDSTEEYNTHRRAWKVGPTAYPAITDQEYCSKEMTIEEVEQAKECDEMPGIPMEVAWHPTEDELGGLWPMYEGEELFEKSGWRNMEGWFGPRGEYGENLAWQVFFGGDGSGATLHWHGAAFNNLYVGTKQWRVTPPIYRGFTGMPAQEAQDYLDDEEHDIVLGCVQHAGDMMYIPENWGHSTLTHAFTIGAAVILPPDYHKPKDIPFMFVHINKTGGTSLIQMLRDRCPNEFFEESWGDDHRTFHTTAESFINRYGKTVWDNAYTFTVVRHPLARQVSNFFFLASICDSMPELCNDRLIPKYARGDDMYELSDKEKIEAFHEWVWDLYNEYPPGSKEQYFFGSRTQGNEENKHFNATQTSWLVDHNDEIAVKEIFQLEHIDDAMKEIAESIPCLKGEADKADGTSAARRVADEKKNSEEDVHLIHKNTTPKYPDWKKFGENKKTKKIMEEVYAADFRNFGYKW